MKKLLLGLGTLAAVAAPVAAVVACGSEATYGAPSKEQATALAALATKIKAADTKTNAKDTLTDQKIEVKGDLARITFSAPVAPATADAPDTTIVTGVRYTINLSSGYLVTIETQKDNGAFVKNDAADATDLNTAVKADVVAAIKEIADAVAAAKPVQVTLSDAAKLVDGFEVEVRADQTDAKVQTLAKASDETAADIKKLFEGATEVGEVTFQTEAAGKLEHKREVHYFNVADEDKALLTKLASFIGSTANDFKADGTLKTQYIPLSPSVEPTDAMKSADFQITIFDWNDAPGIKASFSLHSASTASTTEMISGIAFEKK